MFLNFREKGRERKRGRERDIDMRNIDWLPPIHVPTADGTCILLVRGTTLQPTEPPGQGNEGVFSYVLFNLGI